MTMIADLKRAARIANSETDPNLFDSFYGSRRGF